MVRGRPSRGTIGKGGWPEWASVLYTATSRISVSSVKAKSQMNYKYVGQRHIDESPYVPIALHSLRKADLSE